MDKTNSEFASGVYHGRRLAKCHGYDGYIRVKIFAGWAKKFGRTCNFEKIKQCSEDFHNLCR